MIETMRNKIEQIVEQACATDTNIFGYDIWTHHILPVVQNAKQLASRFDADPEIMELAALLHDYASIKDKALYANHIEQAPSLLYLAYVHHGMGIDEGKTWVKAKLQRSWQKLREDVQDIVRDTYEAALKML